MIPITAVIRRWGLATKRGQASVRNKILKQAYQDTLVYWHDTLLAGHFVPAEEFNAKYPGVAKPRTREYLKKKRRAKNHVRLNVFSGETQASMAANYSTSGTSKGARIRMKIPQIKAQSKGKGRWSSRPIQRLTMETTATNKMDEHRMAKYLEGRLAYLLNFKVEGAERVEIQGWGGGL